jgi:hypothetical protein
MRGRRTLLAGLTIATALAVCGTAQAVHHFVKITEVYPGSSGTTNAEFVELRMYASGQGDLDPHAHLNLYGPSGASVLDIFPSDVANEQSQRTFLYASSAAESSFGVEGDFGDGEVNDYLSPAGGAVCFDSNLHGLIDCVAWGTVTPNAAFASAGTPAVAIDDTKSLSRSLAGRPCPIGLDAGDDTNSSFADFGLTTPTPLPNSEPPNGCPDTRFTKKPKKVTTKRRAVFKFTATPAAASFECKLDKKPFKPCTSPFRKRVKPGKHKFRVLAEDEISPERYSWTVVSD